MHTNLRGRDFITDQEWTREELETALDVAFDLKRKYALGEPTPLLAYKTLFMLFFFSSTRTRTSFEAGISQLGGHGQFIEAETTQIKHGDTPKEMGRILSRYGHGIAIRQCDWGVGSQYIRDVAEYASVPVLNMQCDVYHPFQAMADLMTIIEKKRDLRRRKVVMSWAYAASYTKPISVPQSAAMLFARFGMDVVLAHPPEFTLMPDIVEQAKDNARQNGGSFEIVHDMEEAFKDADVVYPKSWGCLLTTSEPTQAAAIAAKYRDWICDERRMKLCKDDAIYLHCLPADRGIEVADAVIDGPQSVVYDEAENRLHVQKAIMALTMR
jgi:N-acetylornithine carbamoyltransferase